MKEKQSADEIATSLKFEDVAGLLGVSVRTVKRISANELPRYKVRRKAVRFRLCDVAAFQANCRIGGLQ